MSEGSCRSLRVRIGQHVRGCERDVGGAAGDIIVTGELDQLREMVLLL